MLQFVNFKSYKFPYRLVRIWNHEYKKEFPLLSRVYKTKILEDKNFNQDASFVALYDNKLVGFIIIKSWLDDSGLYEEKKNAHISLLFVKKEMRNMHIGSDLLNLSIEELRKHKSIKTIQLGREINNLLSGLPEPMNKYSVFFMNKGFKSSSLAVDMISLVRKNSYELEEDGNVYEVATEEDNDLIVKYLLEKNCNKEAYLIEDYFKNNGSGRRIIIALNNEDKIIGVSRLYHSNKFATLKEIKNINYSRISFIVANDEKIKENLLKASVNYLMLRKAKKIIISDADDVSFYKNNHFAVYKNYLGFEKEL